MLLLLIYAFGFAWNLSLLPPIQVGPSYGRKMMTGYLATQGFRAAQIRVGSALRRVNPYYHTERQSRTLLRTNPIPYKADYFGQKVHIDQNEKLTMFGCTHVCAIDGFSGKIVGFVTMPVKNCVIIYEHLYRWVNIIIFYM